VQLRLQRWHQYWHIAARKCGMAREIPVLDQSVAACRGPRIAAKLTAASPTERRKASCGHIAAAEGFMSTVNRKPMKKPSQIASVVETPAQKALRTAKWARIMTKWLISHSSKDGVKWQVVSFNGKAGHESKGIVDMIAIRKNHAESSASPYRGDLFEIVLVQVKGGGAAFPSDRDIERLMQVRTHHKADKVVLTEWKKGEKLCCYLLPDTKKLVPASEIFGKPPSLKKIQAKAVDEASATSP
jgi:hypothetical protein